MQLAGDCGRILVVWYSVLYHAWCVCLYIIRACIWYVPNLLQAWCGLVVLVGYDVPVRGCGGVSAVSAIFSLWYDLLYKVCPVCVCMYVCVQGARGVQEVGCVRMVQAGGVMVMLGYGGFSIACTGGCGWLCSRRHVCVCIIGADACVAPVVHSALSRHMLLVMKGEAGPRCDEI